ncbi:MAG: putative DNA binding domain-containing protein [Magnetococcales bacterium]|nr:putative DNA binding domain-containing protein [Magnetococcales bacterium]
MIRTELLEILLHGENSGVEFKRDLIRNDELARELVAFANFEGGMVLLGVGDDGQLVGLTRDKLEEWVMTVCRDKIRPAIIPFFEWFREVEPGKDVAVVRVSAGYDVHTLWHNNKNSYYIRVGSQSREATPEELRRLFQRRSGLRAELSPVSGAGLRDLDVMRLKNYFSDIRQQEIPADEDESGWEGLLYNTEIMVEGGVGVAGMLLFGHQPKRFLPQAGIEATAYPGREKDYAARERCSLRGPMVPRLDRLGKIVELGLVEQAMAFVQRNTSVSGGLEEGGVRREEKADYPKEAVREAVVNALVHRDYLLTGTDIELSIYEDRLEVISPGRLPNGITPARMVSGCRAARNSLIKDIMRDYRYLEPQGMGVPRKIVKGMMAHNGTRPDLVEDGERFVVRLKK